jgi:hypothetical protein
MLQVVDKHYRILCWGDDLGFERAVGDRLPGCQQQNKVTTE